MLKTFSGKARCHAIRVIASQADVLCYQGDDLKRSESGCQTTRYCRPFVGALMKLYGMLRTSHLVYESICSTWSASLGHKLHSKQE